MKNTTELRDELVQTFKHLKARQIDIQAAKTMVAVTNSILKSASLEMDHKKMTGDEEDIQFLKTPRS